MVPEADLWEPPLVGGAAGTLASVDFATSLRIGLFTQYMLRCYPIRQEFIDAVEKDMATFQLEHKWMQDNNHIAFSGSPIDRADHLRADPEARQV